MGAVVGGKGHHPSKIFANSNAQCNRMSRSTSVLICKLCGLLCEALLRTAARPGAKKVLIPLLWVWGRSMLRALELSRGRWQQRWSCFLQKQGICSSSYSIHRLSWHACAYVKLSYHFLCLGFYVAHLRLRSLGYNMAQISGFISA